MVRWHASSPRSFDVALALALLLPLAAWSTPPAGTYSGVTGQSGHFSITVNASGQISSYQIYSSCANVTATLTCNIVADSFSCGSSFCAPDNVPRIALSGTFDPGYELVHGAITIAIQGVANPIPPACCQISGMSWMAKPDTLVFKDGFEGSLSLAWSSFVSDEPFIDFSVYNRLWKLNGTDALRLLIDDAEVLSIPEGHFDLAQGYRTVRVGLGAWAGSAHEVRFEATSYADGTRADFHLDDVVVDCPAGVANPVGDPSFEAGTPNPAWSEESTNFGTPVCDATCGASLARTGAWWVWFGGYNGGVENGAVTQPAVSIPSCP